MKQERLNSEKKINCDNFKLKIGTINKKNPKVIYIDGSTFIIPLFESNNYDNDIFQLKKIFLSEIKKYFVKTNLFSNKFIFNLDIKSNGLKKDKKSFLAFQCHLLQENKINTLSTVKKNTEITLNNFIKSIENDIIGHNFMINKYKK